MSANLNQVILAGRLTRDPELRYTPSGSAVCNFSVVTSRYGRGENGESKEYPEFTDVVVWSNGNRKTAESCGQYLAKGKQVLVSGRLQTRSWENDGVKHRRTEVIAYDVQFLSPRDESSENYGSYTDVDPSEIPF